MFRDELRYEAWDEIRQSDLSGFRKLLPDSVLEEAGRRAGVEEQHCPLCGANLVWLGIVAALHHTLSCAKVLTETVRMLDLAANGLPEPIVKGRRNAERCKSKRSKHDPRGTDPAVVSEEAFVHARRNMPQAWWECLIHVLTERFEGQHGQVIRWKEFRLLSLDGTTLRLPKAQRLSKHFGTSGNGKKRTAQARMVLLQFPLVRLPWRYKLCPISQGERTVAERLLKDLKPQDLVLMDRGFWSYGLFHQVQSAGAFFGIRLPAKVKLRTLVITWSALITAAPSSRPRIVRGMLKHIASHQVPFRPGRHEPRPNVGKTKNLGYGKSRKSHKLKTKRKQAMTSKRQQA